MAAALMRALPAECQLVLVGDPNQLPPVGPGHVLSSLLSLRGAGPPGPPSENRDKSPQVLAAGGGAAPSAAAAAPAGGHSLLAAAVPPVAAAAAASLLPGRGPTPPPLRQVTAGLRLSPQARLTRDLLPRVHLGEVFRQDDAGAIVSGALQIIKGMLPLHLAPHRRPVPYARAKMHLNFSLSPAPPCPSPPPPPPAQYPSAMTKLSLNELLDRLHEPRDVPSHPSAAAALLHLQGVLGSDAVLVEVDGAEAPEAVEGHVVEIVEQLKQFGVDVQADVQVGVGEGRGGRAGGGKGRRRTSCSFRGHPWRYL